jgi:hypothetical protein
VGRGLSLRHTCRIPEASQLRDAALDMLAKVNRATAGAAALHFVLRDLRDGARRVDRLLEPARMEVFGKEQWAAAVEAAVKDFVAVYEQEYLQSDKVIEPFSRLNLEILSLLDPNIPGLNQALQAIRWITRWPSRLILAIGRRVLSVFLGGDDKVDKLPPELKAYADAHTVVLSRLGSLIDSLSKAPRHHPFWDALSAVWTEELKSVSEQFGERIKRHMAETDQEVKHTAMVCSRSMDRAVDRRESI